MKLNRKFLASIGFSLMLTGVVVAFMGFALSGFSPKKYIEEDRQWYQTFGVYGGSVEDFNFGIFNFD